MKETVFPVCSPRLLQTKRPLRTPQDLVHHTLIHDASMPSRASFPQWFTWLQAAGVRGIDGQRGLQLDASMLAIQAAIDGQGVALGRSVLVADDIASGRLVAPFDLTFESGFGYHIVHPRKPGAPDAVRSFVRWVRAEAASFSGAPTSAAHKVPRSRPAPSQRAGR
jgi:LysR family glycine cleavage system transcriptional activator